jgi:hypothetical protein
LKFCGQAREREEEQLVVLLLGKEAIQLTNLHASYNVILQRGTLVQRISSIEFS